MSVDKAVGRHTSAEARDDEQIKEAISWITRLPSDAIAQRLSTARGAMLIRNVFREEWPWGAAALGALNVAVARECDLKEEIEWVTKATRLLVSRRLNNTNGRKLLRNLFWDTWPDEEPAPPPTDVAATPPRAYELAHDTERAEPDVGFTLEPGRRLSSRYTLRRELGKGGFGTTWIAYDQLADLEVVVKIPHAEDGGAIRNELQRAFRVVHPNICQAFPERDDDTGQPFLVMQYGGEDLGKRLTTGQPFPLTLAVHVLVSIADALDYLHDQLVLHLDITPSNILIDEDDVVRLTDFGASAAARTHVTPDGQRTRLATQLHSFNPCYAAPEVYTGQARSRSDQYSLFLVFCSLLEGRLHDKQYYEFRPFPILSDGQNEIVRRALSVDPAARFESCSEPARALADDLARVPEQILASDLDRLFGDFIGRIDREGRRLGTATVRLGGAVKLGRGLERLLQATLRWMAAVDGFDVLEALREFDEHATSLDRVTGGTLAKAIVTRASSSAARHSQVAALVEDLKAKNKGGAWHLINARNDVVHGRRPPEAILPWATFVADLLRSAGSAVTEASSIAGREPDGVGS